ncbi:MAG TPA: HD domain-containing phosphohydrolase [Segeticoccus sp.]|uniref:HD-GYP domain-containing protein n=1 Tax=Segeticoccus sp. TaxID=2706531 RepID=UPI002D7E17BA|nr:HD domain-containing phosphohydrolase [Segeticoccus sp.]HET8601775.1 HD domain-containing phosphohydrolase [Segeticoccus sp.]
MKHQYRLDAGYLGQAYTVVAAVGAVLALVASVLRLPGMPGTSLIVVVAFFLAIAVGESLHVSLLGVRDVPFVAIAASLAFAMTGEAPMNHPTHYHAPLVVATTALAMVVGYLVHRAGGRSPQASDLAARLLVIGLTAWFFRDLPLVAGRTLMDVMVDVDDRRWVPGLVMVGVAAIALLLQVLLTSVARAGRLHAPLRQSIADEARAVAAPYVGLAASASLVSLAERPLGVAAIPLFLFPLLLMQLSVRRHAAVRETYRQTIRSLSRLTDVGGFTASGHSGRVAALAVAVGRDMGLSERELLDLEYAALLHDIGQVSLQTPIPRGATTLVAPTDAQRIAVHGAQIVRETGVLDTASTIMQAQATSYRQVRELGEDLPLSSRILKVANAFDDYSKGMPTAHRQDAAMERIHLGLGYEFDPYVVDSLQRVIERQRS